MSGFLNSQGLIDSSKLAEFCETAEVYAVNSSVWLVDGDKMIATHRSDTTYNNADWDAVYVPTYAKFLEFLEDENWQHVAKKYPQFQEAQQ
jgi:hypothetical protein